MILVVDDFKTARELYVRTFKAGGYDVEEAHNGPEALEFGDVVVAEPADGPVALATGSVILITEPNGD